MNENPTFEDLVETFLERRRLGEALDVEEFLNTPRNS